MLDQGGHVGEPLVEAAKNVEDEVAVTDGLAKITEAIGHALHTAAVFVGAEITLHERAKLDVEEKGAGLSIADELLLKAEPNGASSGRAVLPFHDHLEQIGSDDAVEPR